MHVKTAIAEKLASLDEVAAHIGDWSLEAAFGLGAVKARADATDQWAATRRNPGSSEAGEPPCWSVDCLQRSGCR